MKKSILGLILLGWLVLTRGSYRGLRAFYRRAQEGHPWAVGLLSGPLASLCIDYRFSIENVSRPRLSDMALAQYSDDSLHGYGDDVYDKGGDTIEAQQRGQILPLLDPLYGVVVEIGTGNGDLIAHLAARHPNANFIGIDLSVKTAECKHSLPNLRFVKGYALDVLPACDIVFMCSTAVVFTPAELRAYLDVFKARGVKEIIFNEPTWSDYALDEDRPYSEHLEAAVWFHNFPAYLREYGYRVTAARLIAYQHPKSPRPDVKLALVRGQSRS